MRQVVAAGHTVVLVAKRNVGRRKKRSVKRGLMRIIVERWNEEVWWIWWKRKERSWVFIEFGDCGWNDGFLLLDPFRVQ